METPYGYGFQFERETYRSGTNSVYEATDPNGQKVYIYWWVLGANDSQRRAKLDQAKVEAQKFLADIFTVPERAAAVVREPTAPPPLMEYLRRQGLFTGPWPSLEPVAANPATTRAAEVARQLPPTVRPWTQRVAPWLLVAGVAVGLSYLSYLIYPHPKPAVPVRIVLFEAYPETIDRGECAVLSWDISQKAQVQLLGGAKPIATSDGMITKSVCPNQTTVYELRVLVAGVETDRKTRKVQVRRNMESPLSGMVVRNPQAVCESSEGSN